MPVYQYVFSSERHFLTYFPTWVSQRMNECSNQTDTHICLNVLARVQCHFVFVEMSKGRFLCWAQQNWEYRLNTQHIFFFHHNANGTFYRTHKIRFERYRTVGNNNKKNEKKHRSKSRIRRKINRAAAVAAARRTTSKFGILSMCIYTHSFPEISIAARMTLGHTNTCTFMSSAHSIHQQQQQPSQCRTQSII